MAFLGNVAKQAEQSNSVAAKSNLANNIREFASNGFYLQKNKELYVSILKGLNLPNLVNSIYQLAINSFNVNPFTEQIMKLNLEPDNLPLLIKVGVIVGKMAKSEKPTAGIVEFSEQLGKKLEGYF